MIKYDESNGILLLILSSKISKIHFYTSSYTKYKITTTSRRRFFVKRNITYKVVQIRRHFSRIHLCENNYNPAGAKVGKNFKGEGGCEKM